MVNAKQTGTIDGEIPKYKQAQRSVDGKKDGQVEQVLTGKQEDINNKLSRERYVARLTDK